MADDVRGWGNRRRCNRKPAKNYVSEKRENVQQVVAAKSVKKITDFAVLTNFFAENPFIFVHYPTNESTIK